MFQFLVPLRAFCASVANDRQPILAVTFFVLTQGQLGNALAGKTPNATSELEQKPSDQTNPISPVVFTIDF